MQLSPDELEVLNKVIPTVAFADHKRMEEAIRDVITENNANAAENVKKNDMELKHIQTEYLKNINKFLLDEAFYAEREGSVFFMTEKGRHLKQQRSLQKYYEWKEERGVGLRKDLYTIRTRGYLDQDEIIRNRKSTIIYKIRTFVLYPVIVIIILLLLIGVAHHNGWDKKFPSIRHWLDNKENKTNKNKDSEDDK